jgi:nicotinamidase-related amidase
MAQALLVMDVQAGIVARIADPGNLLNNINAGVEAARKKGITIIYVTVQFRKGFPEISSNNKSFNAIKSVPGFDSEEFTTIHPAIVPATGDIHVIKRRVSAFAGSDLEVILRGQNIDHLILAGISTSGVVLSTVREAADKDYKLTVLEDCCADGDAEIHNVLMKKVFPRQADVLK